ncbi:MAG: benzodiazapine receptor [Bradymonadia bacterium]|jgi:benzodiazapine receptor
MALVGFLVLSFAAAALGGAFPPGEWYGSLTKPSWNPPGWIFGPVWTALYAMIGTSAWLVWRSDSPSMRTALAIWAVQLALNAAWSPIFFGSQKLGIALGVITVMWLAILATVLVFWPIHRTAALLLVPYLCWVGFATVLNATLWRMNS